MLRPAIARKRYAEFIEQAIEDYKHTVSRQQLLTIGDEAVAALSAESQFALTELLLCEQVDRIILRRLELPAFLEWRRREKLSLVAQRPLIDSSGSPLSASDPKAAELLVTAHDVSQDLLLALSRSPDSVHSLSPRKFEELIAEMLHWLGLTVSLTPATRDGGRDIIARVRSPVGAFLCLIECKKYSPEHRVGVRPVRELFGIVSHERVNQGMLVTTSDFTAPARQFAARVPHQLSLKAYGDIVSWLSATATDITNRTV